MYGNYLFFDWHTLAFVQDNTFEPFRYLNEVNRLTTFADKTTNQVGKQQ